MRLFLVVMLAGAGCATTTTLGSAPGPGARRAFAGPVTPQTAVETPDQVPDAPPFVIEAPTPTEISILPQNETWVPVRTYVRPKHAGICKSVGQCAVVGAGIGVVAGLLLGLATNRSGGEGDVPGGLILFPPVFAGGGLIGGLITGAIVVDDEPDPR
jgi:hypothetical protein